ncbi:MAG: DUF1952 domain-containing protein [Planctomycetota bacterium]|jgi:hypothetical protein
MLDREIRGVPLWQIREYLEELGGRVLDDTHLEGDGWKATLAQIEDFQIGSLVVGQVHVLIEGEAATLTALEPRLDDKLIRAGG